MDGWVGGKAGLRIAYSNQKSTSCHQINQELFQPKRALATFNFKVLLYSILQFRNLALAHISPQLKQSLLSVSSMALKLTQKAPNRMKSFINIHEEC